MALLEHSVNAAVIAGELFAMSFDQSYFDGITQALLRGGAHDEVPETR
jgi:hypothetical protein